MYCRSYRQSVWWNKLLVASNANVGGTRFTHFPHKHILTLLTYKPLSHIKLSLRHTLYIYSNAHILPRHHMHTRIHTHTHAYTHTHTHTHSTSHSVCIIAHSHTHCIFSQNTYFRMLTYSPYFEGSTNIRAVTYSLYLTHYIYIMGSLPLAGSL